MEKKRKGREDGYKEKTVTVGHKPDGTPIRKHVYAKKNKDAVAKLDKVKARYAIGQTDEAMKIKLSDLTDAWKELHYIDKEYKTIAMYDGMIKNHIIPNLGHMKIAEVKPYHIEELMIKTRKLNGERYSKSHIHKLRLTIKLIFDLAVKREIILVNPVSKVKNIKIKKKSKDALSPEIVNHVREVCKTHRAGPLVMTMLYSGLRCGEAIALLKSDIGKCSIDVNKAIYHKGNKPFIKIPKNETSIAVVAIPLELYDILTKYMKTVAGTVLFPKASGGYMTHIAVKRLWRSFMVALNVQMGGITRGNLKTWVVPHITPHILRHTYSTMLYRAGVHPKTIQTLMRHASIDMSMEYTHSDKRERRKGVRQLERLTKNTTSIRHNKRVSMVKSGVTWRIKNTGNARDRLFSLQ